MQGQGRDAVVAKDEEREAKEWATRQANQSLESFEPHQKLRRLTRPKDVGMFVTLEQLPLRCRGRDTVQGGRDTVQGEVCPERLVAGRDGSEMLAVPMRIQMRYVKGAACPALSPWGVVSG